MKSEPTPVAKSLRANRRIPGILVLLLVLMLMSLAAWKLTRNSGRVYAQGTSARLYLSSARRSGVSYKGSAKATGALGRHPAALSIAAADLDGDAVTDLAIGFAAPSGGLIAIHRGNLDAFAPQSEASFQAIGRGDFPAPYLPQAELMEIPSRPDFLAAGEFIGPGGSALAAAARGGQSIHVLARGASGKLELLQTIATPGPITGLYAYRPGPGNYWQIAAGVRTPGGPRLALYAGSHDGLSLAASFALAGDATAFAEGNLDGDAKPDLLVVAGGQPAILHGGSRKVEPVSVPYTVTTAALGRFLNDRDPLLQIALLAADGSVHILARQDFDPTPLTLAGMRGRRQAQIARRGKPGAPAPERSVAWKEIESESGLGITGHGGHPPIMFRTRISDNGSDDLMFLGPSRLSVLTHPDGNPTVGTVLERPDLAADAAVALPVRVNIDWRAGVVYVPRGESVPQIMMPLPDPTFTVNTTSDFVSSNSSACADAVAGQCSLREAIIEANAAAGTDTIMVPAGTYTLTIARATSPTYNAHTGTLDVTESVNIVGAAQATTIIQGGTLGVHDSGGPNGVDKVFSFNQDITAFTNASVMVSDLTIQNGYNRGSETLEDGWGGAFDFDTGTDGTATLTLTDVTLNDNTLTQGEGGGFAVFNTNAGTGKATLTGCIVENNVVAPDSSGAGGHGGGVAMEYPATLEMTSTQVTGNEANTRDNVHGIGGGFYTFGNPGTDNILELHSVTVSSNSATGDGGGIYSGAGLDIDQSSVISNNTSGGDGGGIWFSAYPAAPATLAEVTITGNSAANGGGIYISSGNQAAFTMQYSRIATNSASAAGANLSQPTPSVSAPATAGTVTVTEDWWGTNSPLSTMDLETGNTTTYSPYIVLALSASPTTIKISQTSTLTADVSKDSGGTTLTTAELVVFSGLPVTFAAVSGGSITTTQPVDLSTGAQANSTYQAGGVGANGEASVTLDGFAVDTGITILQPPSMTKSFGPTTVAPVTTSTLTFSVTNGNTVTIDANFSDSLPSGLVVAATPAASNGCGGTVTATAGTGSISFSNPVLPVGTCTITVKVSSATDNTYINSVTLDSTAAGNATSPSTATLTVVNPPNISKAFGASTVPLSGSTSLTITVSSTNANVILSGVAFTDTLPSGLVVSTPNNLNSTCSGTTTGIAGAGTVSVSAATLAAGGSCTVSLSVTGTTAGVQNNSVQATSTNGGTSNTANASVTVVSPPTISKVFGASTVALNTSTSLGFTIHNNNTTITLTGVGFSDTLPSGLAVASPSNGLSGSCGGGTISATAGGSVVSLTGASVAASSFCTFSVNVTGTAAGAKNNTTTAVTSNEGGTGLTANASLTVVAPPTISKVFGAANLPLNGTTTLTFTLTNPTGNTVSETGVAFSDSLLSGLQVASAPGVSDTCGGSVTAAANTTTISLSGGAISASSTCTITVNVIGTQSGTVNNTTGAISSTNGGTGTTSNTASLVVASPPTISKSFGASTVPVNGTSTTLTFSIHNPNSTVGFTNVAFTDNFPSGLVVAATPNAINTCGGSVTATAGASSVSLSAPTLAASATCTVSVSVQGTTVGVKNNSVQASSAEGGTGTAGTASITVVGPPTISKSFGASTIPVNGSTSLSFTISNLNTTVALSGVAFSDTLPSGLAISSPSNGLSGSCGGGTITATAGGGVVSLSGATLAASTPCTFSVNVTGTTAGTQNNTTAAVTSNEGGTGLTASASVSVLAAPVISKSFGSSSIALNATTSLTFTITNPAGNTVSLTGVGFNDTLPTGLTVTSAMSAQCGGTVTVTALVTIALSGATVATGAPCQFSVTVTGAASGSYTNTTGNVTSTNGGTGNTATANLTVASPPVISKSFGASTIPVNGTTTTLSFTIQNPNSNVTLHSVGFTDSFPSGIVVAATPGATNNCGGTFSPVAAATSVTLSGVTLANNGSCAVSVSVQGTTAGVKNNSVQASSTEGGTGTAGTASITVVAPPTISKSFVAASIPLNGSTSLSFTISNLNTTVALSGVAFSDTLPAGLAIASPNGLTGSCGGGTITATAGTGVVSLSGATLAASTPCTFSVNVTGTAAGTQNNTTSAVISNEGGTGLTASASVLVEAPPVISKSFVPSPISLNSTTLLTFTITNPTGNPASLTGVGFTDTLPTGLTVANGTSSQCGGTLTVTAPVTIMLAGATVATGAPCQFSVTVTGASSGSYTNTTGNVTSTNGGTGNTATAGLTVGSPPVIGKSFGASTIPVNGTTTLTLTIQNPNSNVILHGVAFTDSFPSGLVVATTPNLSNNCGGTLTAVAGAGSASLSAGVLAVSTTCTISMSVQGATAGVKSNSVQVTSTEGGTGNTATASITVVAPPSISKSFGAPSIPLNGSTSLSFTISNMNTTVALSGVGFSDTLPAGLAIASPNGLSGSCGGGTITATAGTGVVSLTGATLAASAPCTFSVTVKGTAAGLQNNTTGAVTSTEGGTGSTASASIVVIAPPTISKAFGASNVSLNGTTTLSFTLTNPAANTVAEAGVAFSDTLTGGLQVAATPGLTNTCSGTVTAAANSTSISLSGGSIAQGSTCTLVVNVTGTQQGQVSNTTGAVSSTNGGTGTTSNTATLSVASAPSITKSFGAATVPLGGTTTLSFNISNPNTAVTLTGIAFSDTLPAGLTVAATPGATNTCGGTLTAGAGAGTVSLSSGTIASSSSCAVSVHVAGATAGVKNNSVTVTSTEGGTGNTSNASITVVAPPTISKTFGTPSVALNGSTSLSFMIQNSNATVALTGVAFSDTLPSGLVVSTPNGLTGSCGGTVTATPNSSVVSLAGGAVAAAGSCTFSVNVTGTAAGTVNNVTGAVTSTEGGTGQTATASIYVVAPPTITKSFGEPIMQVGGDTPLTFTITNPAANTVAATGVAVTDTLPTGMAALATSESFCGGTLTASGRTISLSGATVPVNIPCVFIATVTVSAAHTYQNVSGNVSSTNGGTGNTASASVTAVQGSISASIGVKSGPLSARVWPIQITNNASGVASNAEVTSISFTPVFLATCTPKLVSPLPVVAGSIPSHGSATARVTIDFGSCTAETMFSVSLRVTADGGSASASLTLPLQLP